MADIEILEVDIEGVGQPLKDGAPGSALYRVPIKLSAAPSELWAHFAVETWDHPPSYTTMHRPGIATVIGDCFILDGTTLEEVESTHAKTLKLVVEKANQLTREAEGQERIARERSERDAQTHAENVERVAKRIKFD